jgi:hypothetical protein
VNLCAGYFLSKLLGGDQRPLMAMLLDALDQAPDFWIGPNDDLLLGFLSL